MPLGVMTTMGDGADRWGPHHVLSVAILLLLLTMQQQFSSESELSVVLAWSQLLSICRWSHHHLLQLQQFSSLPSHGHIFLRNYILLLDITNRCSLDTYVLNSVSGSP